MVVQASPEYTADPNVGNSINSPEIQNQLEQYAEVFRRLGFHQERSVGYLKFVKQVDERAITLTAGARSKSTYLHPEISRRTHTGMCFSIQVQSTIKTRLLFANANSRSSWLVQFLQRFNGNSELKHLSSRFEGYRIWASDPEWASEYLQSNETQKCIESLTKDCRGNRHTLFWAPEICNFTPVSMPSNLSEEIIDEWIQKILLMVRLAEQKPPKIKAASSWLERQSEKGKLPIIIAAFLLGTVSLLIVGTALLVGLIAFFLSWQF